jgi:asparagine synthetase B (glutamine-hydrolysing)
VLTSFLVTAGPQGLAYVADNPLCVASTSKGRAITAMASGVPVCSCGGGRSRHAGAVVLDSYLRHGRSTSAHLLGQYSAAVLEHETRKLTLVQDSLGLHPLFYSHDAPSGTTKVGTSIGSLSAECGINELDLEYVADYIVRGACCTDRTPFRRVRRVFAGQTIVIDRGRFTYLRPWTPDQAKSSASASSKEWPAQFKDHLFRAVGAYACTSGVNVCEVSGGLDSSTVFYVLDVLGQSPVPVSVVSRSFDDDGDTEYLRELFSARGDWLTLDANDHPPFAEARDGSADEPGGEISERARLAYQALVRSAGADRLFSGLGGDQVFGGDKPSPFHFADYLRRVNVRKLRREADHWATASPEARSRLFWIVQFGVRPLLQHIRRQRIGLDDRHGVCPDWLHERFVQQYEVEARARSSPFPFHPVPSMNASWQDVYAMTTAEAASPSVRFDCSYVHPLFHRPLVEFMFSLPASARFTPTGDRILQRQALVDVVPDRVLKRTTKGSGHHLFSQAMIGSEWLRSLGRRSLLAELGVVQPDRWARAIDRLEYGSYGSIGGMYAAIMLESWLRRRFGSGW